MTYEETLKKSETDGYAYERIHHIAYKKRRIDRLKNNEAIRLELFSEENPDKDFVNVGIRDNTCTSEFLKQISEFIIKHLEEEVTRLIKEFNKKENK